MEAASTSGTAAGELNVNISGGTISGNTDYVGASSIALNQLASDFARLNLSGSPAIDGEVFLFDNEDGTGPTIHVLDGFAPASAIPIRTNYTPTTGATAVYYDGSDTPYLAHFTSADSSYGLKAEGQTLVWSELYRVAFYDENNRHRYGYLYIVPGSTIDESQIPGGVPTKEGYSLLGWRRYTDGSYWNFATDTVTYGPQSLLSWWKADAPSVTVSASATEAHPGDSITLTATATHDAAADMTFTYQWYKDGTAIPNATADTLTVTESGSYTVEVIADPGRLEASDPGTGTAACTVAHTFDDTKWVSGEDTHYHLCTVAGCTARSDEAEHTFAWVIDKAATTAEPGSRHQECTVCGYEKAAEEIPVIHHFDTKWSYDEKVHYHACTVEGCTVREDEAEHTFQWVVDKKATTSKEGSKHEECTVCGYKKAAVAIPVLDPTTPSTGDHSNLLLWAVVLVLALAGLGATAFFTVRKKRGSSK